MGAPKFSTALSLYGEAYQRKVLLIGWDAADWEHITPLVEGGLMPTFDAFVNRGVMGNLATLQSTHRPGPDERRRSALHELIMQA